MVSQSALFMQPSQLRICTDSEIEFYSLPLILCHMAVTKIRDDFFFHKENTSAGLSHYNKYSNLRWMRKSELMRLGIMWRKCNHFCGRKHKHAYRQTLITWPTFSFLIHHQKIKWHCTLSNIQFTQSWCFQFYSCLSNGEANVVVLLLTISVIFETHNWLTMLF